MVNTGDYCSIKTAEYQIFHLKLCVRVFIRFEFVAAGRLSVADVLELKAPPGGVLLTIAHAVTQLVTCVEHRLTHHRHSAVVTVQPW